MTAKERLKQGNIIDNFTSITLLNAGLEILEKVPTKRFALVIGKLVDNIKKCAVPGRNIHDNLHLMRYIKDSVT